MYTSYREVGFMCDFTTALGNLSEAFQSDHISLSATLGYLKQLMTSPGTTSSQFFLEFDDTVCPTTFRGFDVEGLDLSKRDSEALTSGVILYRKF